MIQLQQHFKTWIVLLLIAIGLTLLIEQSNMNNGGFLGKFREERIRVFGIRAPAPNRTLPMVVPASLPDDPQDNAQIVVRMEFEFLNSDMYMPRCRELSTRVTILDGTPQDWQVANNSKTPVWAEPDGVYPSSTDRSRLFVSGDWSNAEPEWRYFVSSQWPGTQLDVEGHIEDEILKVLTDDHLANYFYGLAVPSNLRVGETKWRIECDSRWQVFFTRWWSRFWKLAAVLTLAFPAVLLIRSANASFRRPIDPSLCPRCSYELNEGGMCSECGYGAEE